MTHRNLQYPKVAGHPDPKLTFLTSESVTEGHPDKVADAISDAVLDACLEADRGARVACETLVKRDRVVLAGEVTLAPGAEVDVAAAARQAIRDAGYIDPDEPFHADGVRIHRLLTRQSGEIARAVGSRGALELGAGDQGIVYGYATDETVELMPLPILLAHRLSAGLAEARRSGAMEELRPDGKTQVTVAYREGRPVAVTDVVVSTQHAPGELHRIRAFVTEEIIPAALGRWRTKHTRNVLNPAGAWHTGGPAADAGLTGRKIIVDTYGGAARHGGGAFSGKDATKVDRSGAYFCRKAARRLVLEGYARRAEVQVSYAIGQAEPVSIGVDTFGTGDPVAARAFLGELDFRPASIIAELALLRPLYRTTTNYGHLGRVGLPWEVA